MSSQLSIKEAGRAAAKIRLLSRSPGTQRYVKRQMQDMGRKNAASTGEHSATPTNSNGVAVDLLQAGPQQPTPPMTRTQSGVATRRKSREGQTSRDPKGNVGIPCRQRMNLTNPRPRAGDVMQQATPMPNALTTVGRDSTPSPQGDLVAATCGGSVLPLPAYSPEGRRSLQGPGGAPGNRGQPQHGQPKNNGGRRRKLKKKIPDILTTPPGWVALAIAVQNRESPPILRQSTQRSRVARNLIDAVDAAASHHGAHRLTGYGDGQSDSSGPDEEQLLVATQVRCRGQSPRDCKEAPRRSRCTRGQKGNALLTSNDSSGWYTSCESGDCQHTQQSSRRLHSLGQSEDAPKRYAMVLPGILGLSPTSKGGHMLRGEIIREFIHAVTGDDMLLVDFSNVIGERALPRKDCLLEAADGAGPSRQFGGDQRRNPIASPMRFIGTQQRLLPQFEVEADMEEGLTQFLVGGDVELPPLTGEDSPLLPSYSPTLGVTYPEYLLPILSSGSDDESTMEDGGDPDWEATYGDFACDSDAANSDWELDEPEIFEEVGPLFDMQLDDCLFDARYGDGHWNSLESTLVGDRETFSGPLPGPTHRQGRRRVEIHEFFDEFWPETDLARICRETNSYALQESVQHPGVLNGRGKWKVMSVVELRAWLGVCILMGLKQQPTIRSYWSKRNFYGCSIIKHVMKRPRFEQILSCIHLVDNSSLVQDKTAEGYDKIGKCRWLIENFVSRSKAAYNCDKYLACDEIMVAYKGRRCDIKQYMKDKLVKYGIKVWCCASSKSRYVYNLMVYEGRKHQQREKDLGEKVVLALMSDLNGLGHVVVTNRFFTSVHLADTLMSLGTWMTGTVKPNRVGMPSHLVQYAKEDLPRGSLVAAMHMSRRMAACVWFDSCPVFFLSTSCDPIRNGCMTLRWVNGRRDEFSTSPIQKEYQEMMRGVDVVDQCRVEYTAQIMSHKWWHRLLFFVLDSSLGNAYVLYRAHWAARKDKGQPKRPKSRADFHYAVASWLTTLVFQLGRTGGSFNIANRGLHECRSARTQRRKCRLCGRRVNRFCPGCAGAFLCQQDCYRLVHTNAKFAAKIWL